MKVSAYARDGKVLLIIANFNEDAPVTAGAIRIDRKALGLKGALLARDVFSNEEVLISEKGEFSVDIKSFRLKWVYIEGR